MRIQVDRNIVRSYTNSVHLLEEGLIHLLWREIFLDDRLLTRRWTDLITNDGPLVVLEASGATRYARIKGKRKSGVINQRLAECGVYSDDWQRAEATYELVLQKAEQRRPSVRVTTEGSEADALVAVLQAVKGLRCS